MSSRIASSRDRDSLQAREYRRAWDGCPAGAHAVRSGRHTSHVNCASDMAFAGPPPTLKIGSAGGLATQLQADQLRQIIRMKRITHLMARSAEADVPEGRVVRHGRAANKKRFLARQFRTGLRPPKHRSG